MPAITVTPVGDGVSFVQGAAANWVILTSDTRTGLIDTGYPGDWAAVRASLRAVGRETGDVDSVYVTHGHIDHIGSAERLRREHGAVIHASHREAPHVRREYLEQVGIERALRVATTGRGRRWLAHVLTNGASATSRWPRSPSCPTHRRSPGLSRWSRSRCRATRAGTPRTTCRPPGRS